MFKLCKYSYWVHWTHVSIWTVGRILQRGKILGYFQETTAGILWQPTIIFRRIIARSSSNGTQCLVKVSNAGKLFSKGRRDVWVVAMDMCVCTRETRTPTHISCHGPVFIQAKCRWPYHAAPFSVYWACVSNSHKQTSEKSYEWCTRDWVVVPTEITLDFLGN